MGTRGVYEGVRVHRWVLEVIYEGVRVHRWVSVG